MAGQSEQIKIRIGLPLSDADGGTGGLKGAWNGKNRDLGGGGYAGSVGAVTSSTNLGYVGTSTDTGHTGGSGSFALNPDKTVNLGLIRDFARDGIRQQHLWGPRLAKTYYGMAPVRKYWMGCSTGGRQGHYQAQNFPDAYDGILAGAPAFNWDRFIPAELWPQIVMNQELGAPISTAKLTAVTNAAIAACDAIDGVTDGIIEDPRRCKYDAKSFVCTGSPGDPPNCLTAADAVAVNKIWDGPVVTSPGHGGKHHGRHDSGRAWYGLERGTPLTALAGGIPFPIAADHYKFWIKQDPAFDWKTVTEPSFFKDFVESIEKFNKVIGTDDGLEHFRRAGGKMITYHGLFDQLIMPRGTYNCYNNVSGSIEQKQKFYRTMSSWPRSLLLQLSQSALICRHTHDTVDFEMATRKIAVRAPHAARGKTHTAGWIVHLPNSRCCLTAIVSETTNWLRSGFVGRGAGAAPSVVGWALHHRAHLVGDDRDGP